MGEVHHLLRQAASGKLILAIEGLEEEVNSLAFSPDGSRIGGGAGWTTKGRILVWDAETGAQRHRFQGHDSYTGALAFSADGKRLASGHRNGTALVWRVR